MERQAVLNVLLNNYNEDKSTDFYCQSCIRIPAGVMYDAILKAEKKLAHNRADRTDLVSKVKAMKAAIRDEAKGIGVELG